MERPFTFGSLFSGIGGIDLGLERAGMQCTWQVEIKDYATKVLEKHWPDVTRFRDVRECNRHNLAPVDIIAGGFPCQPHSVAGERNASKDERDLWPEFYRIICDLRPRWVLAENVPGLLSSENGRFFGGILRDLAQARYDVEWGVLSAAQFGAPHLRERVFIVAHTIDTRQQDTRHIGSSQVSRRQEPRWIESTSGTGRPGESNPSTMAHVRSLRSNAWRTEPEGQQRQANAYITGTSTLADTSSVQSQRWGDIGNMGSETPESTSSEKERQRLWNASPDCGTNVAHASSQRCEERDATTWDREQGQCTRLVSTSRVPGQSQSCMGRIFDGISAKLGEYRWPARPGEQQYDWEAPRVTTEKPAHRIAQLEALGNAVVPQIPEALGRRILSIDNEVVA